ncbi:unnamed protein product [Clonostachys solani]|uniref:Uncharacterized protein n=1 Tax=Clonostachys solani TaxID=160281 RepID=A0A9N9ZDA2_9HYPO|nr:unnamed protein product [Clonostachys solani]
MPRDKATWNWKGASNCVTPVGRGRAGWGLLSIVTTIDHCSAASTPVICDPRPANLGHPRLC